MRVANQQTEALDGVQRLTIARSAHIEGLGVITGRQIKVRLEPGDEGIVFCRDDTGLKTRTSVQTARLGPSWSAVGEGDAQVNIVEHLLAALAATGITDVTVIVNGPELPLLDGSAWPWLEILDQCGTEELAGEIEPIVIDQAFSVADCQAGYTMVISPSDTWRLVYVLDWDHHLVGTQVARLTVSRDEFAKVARARTFARYEDIQAALQAGVFSAGSEENVVVIYEDRLSAQQPVDNGFACHKLVDLIGDMYLTGRPWRAQVVAYNSGHALNHQLIKQATQPR